MSEIAYTRTEQSENQLQRPNGSSAAHQRLVEINSADPVADVDDGPVKYSDAALAEIFINKHKNQFRWVEQWGWMQWTGSHWARIGDGRVMGYLKPICVQQSKLCVDDRDVSASWEQRLKISRGVASSKTVVAATKIAGIDHRLYLEASKFDTNPWLFNTPGGTINLKTGELRPHEREDLITKIAGVSPSDRADCPKWMAFLDQITEGNLELQSYLQRLSGYAMVGDPSEECLDFFYGQGGNGKGTFLRILQFIFGTYATTAATETFLESKWSRHPTDVAKLAGARLVIAQEIDKGRMWNEALVKTLTGRDVMTARFMRKDFFDFLPQFTLIISGNNKPSLKTVDMAWRRRLHLVPFNRNIPPEEQNPKLKTELEAEASGILRWCVEGNLLWQENRLSPPAAVLDATEEYFQDEDTFTQWTEECCLRGYQGEELLSLLYESYRQWKTDRGEHPQSNRGFSKDLKNAGFEFEHSKKGTCFSGIRLTDDGRIAAMNRIAARKSRQGDSDRPGSPYRGDDR
jgi:P4 family phage/plasmid primase-like protien